jgi:hypothetical protein
MATPEEYEAKIRKLNWPGLNKLWKAIKERDTPEWEPGKALEYMIMRGLELGGADVRWPYSVALFGMEVEQIDGSIRIGGIYALVECKDEDEAITIAPIAKLRNQLLRRPAGTAAYLFASQKYTDPAIQLAHFSLPQAILLWTGMEVEYALAHKNLAALCEVKYRACVDYAIPDFTVGIEEVS